MFVPITTFARRGGARWLLAAFCTVAPIFPLAGQTSDADQIEMYVRVGVGTLRQGRYQDAETAFRKLLEAFPCNSRGILGLAEIAFAQKLPDDAAKAAESQAELCAARPEALQSAGDIYLRAEKLDRAIATYLRALDLTDKTTPAAGQLHFRLAEAYHKNNDRDNWGKYLDLAAASIRNNSQLMIAQGIYLDAIGKKESAMAKYREALAIEPANGQALNNLAFLMVETGGDLENALEMAKRARNILPDSSDVADTLGWIYARKRWADVALILLKSSLQKDPANQATRKHLLEALDLKDQGSAGQELKAVLQAPHSPENDEKIKQLLFKIK